jgi:hypothetical protein
MFQNWFLGTLNFEKDPVMNMYYRELIYNNIINNDKKIKMYLEDMKKLIKMCIHM